MLMVNPYIQADHYTTLCIITIDKYYYKQVVSANVRLDLPYCVEPVLDVCACIIYYIKYLK